MNIHHHLAGIQLSYLSELGDFSDLNQFTMP